MAMKLNTKYPSFPPTYDFTSPITNEALKVTKGSKEGAEKSKEPKGEEKGEEYSKGKGFTGRSGTIHEHEDGSFHTHTMSEDGDEEKMEHPSYAKASAHLAGHFGEEASDREEGNDGDRDDEAGEDDVSGKKGIGSAIRGVMA